MNVPDQVPVVVVGAGPTGLTLACTLRRAGVEVLVVDKAADSATTSRAAVVHARTLEVLEELDVSRRMVADGVTVPVFTINDRDQVLARVDFSLLRTHYPVRTDDSAVVLNNGQSDSSLDAYQQRRRPVAESVVALTDRATKVATLTYPAARALRNTAIRGVGRVSFAQHRVARQLAQLK